MGYTHYFPGLRATHDIIADARLIIAASDVAVCGPSGQGPPVISEDQGIRLNGSRAAGEPYETFHLMGTEVPRFAGMYDSCKTERQPYDEVVTAILIAAAARLIDTRPSGLTSDGSWADWAPGMALFERAVRPLSGDEKLALELDIERMRPGLFHD